jgi:hypothetical protein
LAKAALSRLELIKNLKSFTMKTLLKLTILLFTLCFVFACGKDENSSNGAGENQFKAKINGKDSVYTITKATLQTYSDHKQLTIITSLSGTSFDLYVNAPEITAKEYLIADPFTGNYPDEFSFCYYRILQPNSVYTARAFVSTITGAEYKTVISQISGKNVKGTIKFKALDQGLYTNGELIVDASFSTNLLEIIP